MEKGFNRKFFTARLYLMDLFSLIINIPAIIGVLRNKDISRSFMEKIFIVVTAVNGCTYCSWFHSKRALSSGISTDELQNMLELQFHADADDFEITGLLYSQHYAETDRHPDPAMYQKLVDFYGKKTAKHISVTIKMIFFGNLSGNTFDAFISRIQGTKAPNSNLLFEILFFILHAPLLLPIRPFINTPVE